MADFYSGINRACLSVRGFFLSLRDYPPNGHTPQSRACEPPATIEEAVFAARVRLRRPAAVRVVREGTFERPMPVWEGVR
jgi:hypothetical protein